MIKIKNIALLVLFLGLNPLMGRALKMVTLRNGKKVADAVAIAVFMNLEGLMKGNPIAFFELVQRCRKGAQYKMWGNTKQAVEEWGLDPDGSSCICDLVTAAAEGDGLKLTLVNPIQHVEDAE